MFSWIYSHKKESLWVGLVLAVTLVAHGFNMLGLPYYENDEGTYMSQAWAVLEEGRLAPYTYWYDHAPAGWLLIALWVKLTGGFDTFGFSINSGRVLMLILQLLQTGMMYWIIRKITRRPLVAGMAMLMLAVSPLAIYFHRRVLLDNIMSFWVILSLWLIVVPRSRLTIYIASALAFGMAVLSKENAVFGLPVWLWMVWLYADKHHKWLALIKWVLVFGFLVMLYPLFALLKGELFAPGSWLGRSYEHVSLLETLKFHSGRGGGPIWDLETADFWDYLAAWMRRDYWFTVVGMLTPLVTLIMGIWSQTARRVSLLYWGLFLFMIRGGLVLEFYIVPILPFMAFNMAYLADEVSKVIVLGIGKFEARLKQWMSSKKGMPNWRFSKLGYAPYLGIGWIMCMSIFVYSDRVDGGANLYFDNQTLSQLEAMEWLMNETDQDQTLIVDNYAFIELNEGTTFTDRRAEWYWKVDNDPAVTKRLIENEDELKADFIAMTPQMNADIGENGLELLSNGLSRSEPIKWFESGGWGVEIWAVKRPERILKSSWKSYKEDFIVEGRVLDLGEDGISTSEGQSYAMLRAVWMNDRQTFDEVWGWTQAALQKENGLFAWRYVSEDEIDLGSSTDADTDIALALLMAYQKWDNVGYYEGALHVMRALWDEEVVMIHSRPYLTAGAGWADAEDFVVVNPSYLAPYAYRIFAEADEDRNWYGLVDTSYEVLEKCTLSNFGYGNGVLPPEWCGVSKDNEGVFQLEDPYPAASEYGYNAFRVPWRVALDYHWYGEKRAVSYLEKMNFLAQEWSDNGRLAAVYTHDGKVWEDYESVAVYAGNLAYFSVLDRKAGDELYETKILSKFYDTNHASYWDDPKNYYTQNWGWLGTAMYGGLLPNIWVEG